MINQEEIYRLRNTCIALEKSRDKLLDQQCSDKEYYHFAIEAEKAKWKHIVKTIKEHEYGMNGYGSPTCPICNYYQDDGSPHLKTDPIGHHPTKCWYKDLIDEMN